MMSHRLLRALFAAVTAVALTAPIAAPFACDREPCCAHGEQATHAHHDSGDAVQPQAHATPCPGMQTCGLSAQAPVLTPVRDLTGGTTHVDHSSPAGDMLHSRTLSPLTPPPRV